MPLPTYLQLQMVLTTLSVYDDDDDYYCYSQKKTLTLDTISKNQSFS